MSNFEIIFPEAEITETTVFQPEVRQKVYELDGEDLRQPEVVIPTFAIATTLAAAYIAIRSLSKPRF